MTEVDWSNAAWDTIPAYRLSKETVDSFLQGLFGYYNFYTQVLPQLSTFATESGEMLANSYEQLSTDYWQFWIPYKLTQVCSSDALCFTAHLWS
jgi:hypothetical protein